MNFLKTFIISIVLYLGLNTVFVLIALFMGMLPTEGVMYIVAAIFAPIATAPGTAWIESGIVPLLTPNPVTFMADLMSFLTLIVPPVVTMIVAALLGENQFTGFGAWFLTAFISCCLFAVFLGVGQIDDPYLFIQWNAMVTALGGEIGALLTIIFEGIVNGFFYGCICALIAKKYL